MYVFAGILLWAVSVAVLYRDAQKRVELGPVEGWSPGCWSGLAVLGLPGWIAYVWMNGFSPAVVLAFVLQLIAGLVQLVPIFLRTPPPAA
jgi:hypothetical protein